MRLKSAKFALAALFCLAIWHAHAQTAAPNLNGNYRCEPQPDPCKSGQTFNMLGVIRDGAIDWSNGTRWRKQ